ncbi:PREDICTED: patronin-like, partial [Dinoponera quadriceps]|uniref:Patronin-like n=1 Tax=Dinoponera quadriceps TaxID=609295 RepID=A0A6P3YDH7_DINQU
TRSGTTYLRPAEVLDRQLRVVVLFIVKSLLPVAKSASSATVKKSQSLQQTAESHPYDDRRAGSEESFVVHRGKGIPTLSSVADEKSVARAEAAGRPSNWEEQRRSSYAGRRSRRNSITDDSQLTIENFGGSQ